MQKDTSSDPPHKIMVPDECTNPEMDTISGCIVGAFCGDAIGAPVEFQLCKIPDKIIEGCMSMTISGAHSLDPGQITDDSEMALCALHAMLEFEKNTMDCNKFVKWYSKWMKSPPFGICFLCKKP